MDDHARRRRPIFPRTRRSWGIAALILGLVSVGFLAGWFARPIADHAAETARERRVADAARSESAGFVIELWAKSAAHPAQSALCLLDGKHGLVVSDGRVLNRGSHVDFNSYEAGSFTAGIQGSEQGQVIDLGDAAVLAKKYGRTPTEAMRWTDGEPIVEGDVFLAPEAPTAPLPVSPLRRWVAQAFAIPSVAANEVNKHAQVKPGHVYFVRVVGSRRGASTEIVALIQVLEYDVGSRVKLRCVQL